MDPQGPDDDLVESLSHLKSLIDRMDFSAWVTDAAGVPTWFSRRFLDFTGKTTEQLIREGGESTLHPEHLDRIMAGTRIAFRAGETWEDTHPVRAADGSYRWFLSRAIPIRDESGAIRYWFGTDTDVTRLKELEDALEARDRRKGMLLATVGHELRNPLSAIRMAVDMLEIAGFRPESPLPVGILKRQVAVLTGMLDEILDLSRITRGTMSFAMRSVRLAEVLALSVESILPQVAEKGHRLEQRIEPDLPDVEGDPIRLQRIFSNLLSNATRYTPDGGLIRLSARKCRGGIEVTVGDNGIGIPTEELLNIFDPYARSQAGRKRDSGGLGIGLTIARDLVQRHGGTIQARSDGPGKGSEFVVWLPVGGVPMPGQAARD